MLVKGATGGFFVRGFDATFAGFAGIILVDVEDGQVLFPEGNFIEYGYFHRKFKHEVIKIPPVFL